MNNMIANLMVLTALSFSGTALAAGEEASKAPAPAVQPGVTAPAAPTTAAESAPPATAQKPQGTTERSTPPKRAGKKKVRPKNLDLRHCLELESNAAIAKCAGE